MIRKPHSLSSAAAAPDGLVAEVAGAPFTPTEIGSGIAIGLIGLLMSGLFALLLPTLVDEGRLSASGIGLAAMVEALSTGLVTGAAGIVLRPVRLRMIAAAAATALVILDLATARASGVGVLIVRGLAGVPEGLLLWITVGIIARTATPERWSAVLFTGLGLTQLAVATGLSTLILPRYGANGGYVTAAVVVAVAFPVALLLPPRLGNIAAAGGQTSGAPPLRGWVALAGTLCMASSLVAVSVYLIPLARQAGLSMAVGRTTVSVVLACQMAGGVLATALAGRVRYITVFWACAMVFVAAWWIYANQAPAWLFVGMSGLTGMAAFIAGPFLVPMTIEADPSRRAAMQSGAVQLLAGAFGPLLASFVVSDRNVRGVLVLALGLQIVGLAVATVLHRQAQVRA